MKSTAQLTAAVALLSGAADAFWRMPCQSRSGLARIDPLVNPGVVSPHSHAIHGGKNFAMDVTSDKLLESECTSCRVTQDKSAYWTPALYFIHEDGTTEIVPQVGGMLAYYLLMKNEGEKIEAFPPGFQMLAGDTNQRNFTLSFPDKPKSEWVFHEEETTQANLGLKAIGMNCLNYAGTPEPSMYRHFLPDKQFLDENCPQGIRAELFFPSCWNGELDSDNHMDHMAYPDTVNNGKCPDTHKQRVPSLFYETIWNTNKFKGEAGQFVFSNGDPTGYGYHGDFITGWEESFLQQAIETCDKGKSESGNIEDCDIFDIQEEGEAAKCEFSVPEVLTADNCEGPADGLCGNVPIQDGPGYASVIDGGNEETPTAGYTPPPVTEPAAVPTLSWNPEEQPKPTSMSGAGDLSILAAKPTPKGDVYAGAAEEPEGEEKAPPAPSSASAPPPAAPPAAPAVTPAPVGEPADPAKGKIISTSTYTKDGVVHEVVIEEVPIYVTVDAPPARAKRHAHAHGLRRDREHGILGRRHFH